MRLFRKESGRCGMWEKGVDLLRKIGLILGQTVLDFGCSEGNYTIPAAEIVDKNGKVYALDKDRGSLDRLVERVERKNLTNIEIMETSGEIEIDLSDSSVDVVLLYDVIHLVGGRDSSLAEDRKRLYKEIHRIVRPHGFVSVYPTHLETHTDISSIEEVKKEFAASGFKFEKSFLEELTHDNNIVKGEILNFSKRL